MIDRTKDKLFGTSCGAVGRTWELFEHTGWRFDIRKNFGVQWLLKASPIIKFILWAWRQIISSLKNSFPLEIVSLKGKEMQKILEVPGFCWYPRYLAGCEENSRSKSQFQRINLFRKPLSSTIPNFSIARTNQCEVNEVAAKWLVNG